MAAHQAAHQAAPMAVPMVSSAPEQVVAGQHRFLVPVGPLPRADVVNGSVEGAADMRVGVQGATQHETHTGVNSSPVLIG